MPENSIHVVGKAITSSFLLLNNIPWYTCALHLSSHLLMDSGCFCILAIVNYAAMNIGVHISLQVSVFIFFQ